MRGLFRVAPSFRNVVDHDFLKGHDVEAVGAAFHAGARSGIDQPCRMGTIDNRGYFAVPRSMDLRIASRPSGVEKSAWGVRGTN